MSQDLGKTYEPKSVEERWYSIWEKAGYFKADSSSPKPPFCIVIPPPNVTGSLHMGHALDNTLQDILIRYKRMEGFATLWVPGTDHAGIATQNVVERELEKEKISRKELGREKFVEKVWQWKKESGGKIVHQLRRLGSSCDWSRERFTLDEGLSKAVREVFVQLYKEKLIYRSNYLISWCVRCLTALSDLEVEYEDINGNLTYFKYQTADGKSITVATTRPETMLGDTAVAVHPDDKRYKSFIGKQLKHPFVNRTFPVISDDSVDPKFGTGAVKVTPAHDPNDYALGKQHNLPFITILDETGKMNSEAGSYQGIDRFEARKKVVQDLKKLGLWEKTEPHRHAVGHCQRCRTIVEPRISDQWFVKIAPLAKPASEVVRKGNTKFVPENWTKVYLDWMDNIRDWCISRQLWWGHQIPVWYCEDCSHQTVVVTDPKDCEKCHSKKIKQDPDVLDTWFSSALWPFSTLGWPEKTADLKKFYPTSVLVTGFDIIFFWVARMMMMGMKFMKDVPFQTVHIHALVRDEKGQKMSKSKGNVIDPLQIMDKYGTDAFRFALTSFAIQGRDIPVSEKRIEGYRNFITKIWNASRFAFGMLGDKSFSTPPEPESMPDQWIRTRLNEVVLEVRSALDAMKFNEAAETIYRFFWKEFCDWYLECIKTRSSDVTTQGTLAYVLDVTYRLLHPMIPFITEELWQLLPTKKSTPTIMLSPFPKDDGYKNGLAKKDFSFVQETVDALRNIRSENKLSPAAKMNLFVKIIDSKKKVGFEKYGELIQTLSNIEKIDLKSTPPKPAAFSPQDGYELYVPLSGLVDTKAELDRLQKEYEKAQKDCQFLENRLADDSYKKKAPPQLIEKDEAKLKDAKERVLKLKNSLTSLQA